MTDHDPDADLNWLYARSAARDRSPRPSAPGQASSDRRSARPGDPAAAKPRRPGMPTPDPDAPDSTGRSRPPRPAGRDRPRTSTPAYDGRIDGTRATEHRARTHRMTASAGHTGTPVAGHRPDATPAVSGRRPRRRRLPRPMRWLRAAVLFLLMWLSYLVAVPAYALSQMPRVPESTSTDRPPEQPGTAILLVGSDARADDPNFQPRADTILLLYRPPKGRSVLVSLPRDSYVPVPGHDQTKLNAAYAYGGQPLLIDTVELVTGVCIDGYLEIGFEGFSGLVDAVGGVEVCLPEPMVDDLAQINLPAGCQTIDGAQALGYVRSRYTDVRGDIGRAERQREIVAKVIKKAANPASVLNPVRYWSLNMAVAKLASRGTQTSLGDLIDAGRAMLDISGDNGLSLVVPIADPAGWSEDGQSVVLWDRENALALFDEISRGDTSDLGRFAG